MATTLNKNWMTSIGIPLQFVDLLGFLALSIVNITYAFISLGFTFFGMILYIIGERI